MKIHEVEIDGFGAWNGLSLSGVSDGLTVIYGPNEAGKTTLMQFVRAMLYGFNDERRARYLPPLGGGRAGGRLNVATPRGRLVVHRADDDRGTVDGQVRVVDARGPAHDAPTLDSLLSGVDEPIFRNVFAIGMREIQELGTLSDTAAADMLYRLATGLDRVSLIDVMRELDTSRNRLLAPDGRTSQIVQLVGERHRLSDETSRLGHQARQYAGLLQERDRLDQTLAGLEAEQRRCQQRLDWLDKAAAAREPWQRRSQVLAELKSLGDVGSLRGGALEELDALAAKIKTWKRRIAHVGRKRRDLRREARKLRIRDSLVKHGPRIEALVEQQGWLKSLASQIKQLQGDIDLSTEQLAEEHRLLGLAQPADGKFTFQAAALERLKPLERQCRAAQRQLVEAKQGVKRADDALAEQQADVQKKLDEHGHDDVAAGHQKAGELVTKLRKRVQLDERLADMSRQQGEVSQEGHYIVDNQILPVWLLGVLGGVFAIGVALMLTGTLLPQAFLRSTGWMMAVLGLVSAGAASGVKHWMERSAARDFDTNEQQAALLTKQIADAKAERDRLDAELPKGGGPLLARLAAAEKEQAAIEQLLPLEADRKSTQSQHGSARKRFKQAKEEFDVARRRWRQGLEAAGLPGTLSVKQLRAFADRRDALEEMTRGIARNRNELIERKRERDALHQRITTLVTDSRLKLEDGEPEALLNALHEALIEQQLLVERRGELRKSDRRLRHLERKATRAAGSVRRRRQALLDEAGAADEAQLRRWAVEAARIQGLEVERDTLTRELARIIGDASPAEIEQHLTQHDQPETLREKASTTERRDELVKQVRTTAEQRGQTHERLLGMAGDTQLSDRLLERAAVDQQLREAVERWQTQAVTHRALAMVRKQYESQRQPETLREASQYLAQMTEGRYQRVWTPLDEDVLRVDDRQGQSIRVEVLSRGTREQVYLSLRLALVSAYARRGARLPMLLDDVLVNFDAQRAAAAAGVLQTFAERGHQLIVFTCHEHMARLFGSRGVPVITLPAKGRAYVEPVKIPEPKIIEPVKVIEYVKVVEPPPVVQPVFVAPPPPIEPPPAPKADLLPEPMIDVPELPADPPAEMPRRPRKRLRIEKHSPVVRMHRPAGIFHTSVWHERHDETS